MADVKSTPETKISETFPYGRLSSTHLVDFSKPRPHKLYFYSFERRTWVPCLPYELLPYDLMMLTEGHEEVKNVTDDTPVFVASIDSYRVQITEPDMSAAAIEVTHANMEKARKWRMELLKVDAEVDVGSSEGLWAEARVSWIKSDVVPGVLHLVPRRVDPRTLGYYYIDSGLLAESASMVPKGTRVPEGTSMVPKGTRVPEGTSITGKIAAQQRDIEADVDAATRRVEMRVRDIQGTMKRVDVNTTDEFTKSTVAEHSPIYYWPLHYAPLKVDAFRGPSMSHDDLDGVVVSHHRGVAEFEKSKYSDRPNVLHAKLGTNFDAVVNIRVTGLTPMVVGATAVSLVIEHNGIWINIADSKWDEKESTYVFKDFTCENPLVRAISGPTILVEVKAAEELLPKIKCKFDNIFFRDIPRKLLVGKYSSMSVIPSTQSILVMGHLWGPSVMFKKSDMVLL